VHIATVVLTSWQTDRTWYISLCYLESLSHTVNTLIELVPSVKTATSKHNARSEKYTDYINGFCKTIMIQILFFLCLPALFWNKKLRRALSVCLPLILHGQHRKCYVKVVNTSPRKHFFLDFPIYLQSVYIHSNTISKLCVEKRGRVEECSVAPLRDKMVKTLLGRCLAMTGEFQYLGDTQGVQRE
jgi:hypothetical protein